jgi:hypothetical protein
VARIDFGADFTEEDFTDKTFFLEDSPLFPLSAHSFWAFFISFMTVFLASFVGYLAKIFSIAFFE